MAFILVVVLISVYQCHCYYIVEPSVNIVRISTPNCTNGNLLPYSNSSAISNTSNASNASNVNVTLETWDIKEDNFVSENDIIFEVSKKELFRIVNKSNDVYLLMENTTKTYICYRRKSIFTRCNILSNTIDITFLYKDNPVLYVRWGISYSDGKLFNKISYKYNDAYNCWDSVVMEFHDITPTCSKKIYQCYKEARRIENNTSIMVKNLWKLCILLFVKLLQY